jgi:hypothetical protein
VELLALWKVERHFGGDIIFVLPQYSGQCPFNYTRHYSYHLHVYNFVLLLEAFEGQQNWRCGSGWNLPWAGSAFEVYQCVVVPDLYSIDGVMGDETENF